MPVELPGSIVTPAGQDAVLNSVKVAAGEPGIDTTTAGVLELGGDNATSVEIGPAAIVVDSSGNVAARSFTAVPSGPSTPNPLAGPGIATGGAFYVAQPALQTATRFSALQSAKAGSAPFQQVNADANFNTVVDYLYLVGINAEKGLGLPGVAAEPGLFEGFEGSYDVANWQGLGHHLLMEWYLNYVSPDGATVTNFRPFAFSLLRDSNASRAAVVQVDIGVNNDATSYFLIIGSPVGGPAQGAIASFSNSLIVFNEAVILGTAFGSQSLSLNSSANGNAALTFQDGVTTRFYEAVFHGDAHFYLWDPVNARFQVAYGAGATSAAALTEFQSRVKIDSFGAFAGGDKYVIADATGNLHLSALGPAS